MTGNEGGECAVSGCLRLASRGGLCWGHRKRVARGRPVNTLLAERSRNEWERLIEAHHDLTDVEDSVVDNPRRALRVANANFRAAVYRFIRALNRRRRAEGKRPIR